MATSRSNPAFRNAIFTRAIAAPGAEVMTLSGTFGKTALLALVTIASTVYTWSQVNVAGGGNVGALTMIGAIGGFVLAMLTIFNPTWSPWSAPVYAVLEGLALGGISAFINAVPRYRGIPAQAVMLTFATLVVMLMLYRAGVIRATDRVRSVIINATIAVMVYYLMDLVLSFFHQRMPFMTGGGTFGIIFSAVICGIAALNLILDFDLVDEGVRRGAPKYMEWYGGFSILVTLIWLYLEIARLLMRRR